jgi:hypothetical protein
MQRSRRWLVMSYHAYTSIGKKFTVSMGDFVLYVPFVPWAFGPTLLRNDSHAAII